MYASDLSFNKTLCKVEKSLELQILKYFQYKKIEVSLPEHIRIFFINIRDDMFALMYALITVMYNYIIF